MIQSAPAEVFRGKKVHSPKGQIVLKKAEKLEAVNVALPKVLHQKISQKSFKKCIPKIGARSFADITRTSVRIRKARATQCLSQISIF